MLDDDAAEEFARLQVRLGLEARDDATRIDDRYRLERTLGRGAMGVVHEAWDERLERTVALKLVRAREGVDLHQLQVRLEREARSLARVDHPNIVGVHDVGQHDGRTYLTMQFVPGTTLRRWQADRKPGVSRVVDAYLQAARGLAAAHAEGVVHRDFKPDNVLVGDDDLVRVADFGIAAALHTDPDGERLGPTPHEGAPATENDCVSGTGRLTRTGGFVGTIPYAAPEQLRGESTDDKGDQFAFCVAMWEALTGERPFDARGLDEYEQAVREPPRPDDALPRWIRPILRRGLSHDTRQRFESMDALVAAINGRRSVRRRRALGTVIGLGLATASAVGWGLSSAAQRAERATCDDFSGQVRSVWGPEQREALETVAAAASVRSGYAMQTLDALAEDWSQSARGLCVEQFAPPADHERRRCLEDWLDGLDRSVELLTEHGDALTLGRAPDLLGRLVPPEGDYCALQPSPAVDPEVWSLSESAREASIVGDLDRARARARAAEERARGLDAQPMTAHLAEALAAHGEVLARAGDLSGALQAFERAERHAIGAEYPERLLWMRLLWAKVTALTEAPDAGERALEHLRRAEPLVHALGHGESKTMAAELAEARGMVARARGHHQQAIEQHQIARTQFEALGRPLLAARALHGIGAGQQALGELDAAALAYAGAETLYLEAGVPESYRNRLMGRFNLGQLAYLRAEPAGFEHFEFIMEHGTADERLEVLLLAIGLAHARMDDDDGPARARAWAERGLRELRARPDASVRHVHDLDLAAGSVLAAIDDPRGEPLLHAALALSDQLPPDVGAMTEQTWIDRLWGTGRCDEARTRLLALDARVTELEPSLPGWTQWRAFFDSTPCVATPSPSDDTTE